MFFYNKLIAKVEIQKSKVKNFLKKEASRLKFKYEKNQTSVFRAMTKTSRHRHRLQEPFPYESPSCLYP